MPSDRDLDELLASIRRSVTETPAEPAAAAAAPAPVEPPPAPFPPAPEAVSGTTLEALVKPLLEPMLKAWLDTNLPEIVDAAARAEIARLTGHTR